VHTEIKENSQFLQPLNRCWDGCATLHMWIFFCCRVEGPLFDAYVFRYSENITIHSRAKKSTCASHIAEN